MKKLMFLVIAASAAVVLAACVPAKSGTFSLGTTGVQFTSGAYTFLASPDCSGESEGFDYSGNLKDTATDGNGVFVHAKPDGYGWTARIYNSSGSGTSKAIARSNVHVTGDVCYHETGRVEVCQDRGTLFSDLCDAESFSR